MQNITFELSPHEISVVRRALIQHQTELENYDESNVSFEHAVDEIVDIKILLRRIK